MPARHPTVVVKLSVDLIADILSHVDEDIALLRVEQDIESPAVQPIPGTQRPLSQTRPSPLSSDAVVALKVAGDPEPADSRSRVVQLTRGDAVALRDYLRELAHRPGVEESNRERFLAAAAHVAEGLTRYEK